MIRLLATTIFCCVTAVTAHAATIYSDESAFVDANGGLNYESFEGFSPVDTNLPVINVAGFSMTNLNGRTDTLTVINGSFDTHPTDGTFFAQWFVLGAGGALQFDFPIPVRALGMMLTDSVDQGADTISFSTNGGDGGDIATGLLPDSGELFWGIVAAPGMEFTRITFTHTGTFDAVGFDEVRFSSIPEPSTACLAGLGLVFASFFGLRRRRLA